MRGTSYHIESCSLTPAFKGDAPFPPPRILVSTNTSLLACVTACCANQSSQWARRVSSSTALPELSTCFSLLCHPESAADRYLDIYIEIFTSKPWMKLQMKGYRWRRNLISVKRHQLHNDTVRGHLSLWAKQKSLHKPRCCRVDSCSNPLLQPSLLQYVKNIDNLVSLCVYH